VVDAVADFGFTRTEKPNLAQQQAVNPTRESESAESDRPHSRLSENPSRNAPFFFVTPFLAKAVHASPQFHFGFTPVHLRRDLAEVVLKL
jgi:hypothetical protein